MNFVTLEFATFFLFVLVAGWLLRERDGEYRAFLLVCNLFFYALAGMAFVPLLLAVGVPVISMIPVLVVFLTLQKYIIGGMTAGGVKG